MEYLSQGNQRQRKAYEILTETSIFEVFGEYTPILVGTIPIDIDISSSDLDIICEVHDFEEFEQLLVQCFQEMSMFYISKRTVQDIPRIVCSFQYKKWAIEIFGQPIPTLEQNGYKHMIIEKRLLKILGEETKEIIRELKRSGLKTEPAFGELLRIDGNIYEKLIEMYDWDDQELWEWTLRSHKSYKGVN
ncbi:MAG: DUF4269 domain-containing protein [Paenibacillus sp.]|nr:DUF4269 domain-containing protein [Paenibacillus sp.]